MTNRKSFENVEKWIGKLRALDVKVPGCLIGNKDDVNADRHVVTDKEARRLAENLGLKFFKVSQSGLICLLIYILDICEGKCRRPGVI